MPLSSRGLRHCPFKAKIAGSNPASGTLHKEGLIITIDNIEIKQYKMIDSAVLYSGSEWCRQIEYIEDKNGEWCKAKDVEDALISLRKTIRSLHAVIRCIR